MIQCLDFDLASAIIMVCVLVVHNSNRNRVLLQNRIYSWLAGVALFAALADIADVIPAITGVVYPMWVRYLTSFLYLATINSATTVYAIYTVSLKKNRIELFSKREKNALIIPVTVLWIVLIQNFFTHTVFWFDENGAYHREPLMAILYMIAMYYLVFGVYYTNRHLSKHLSRLHLLAVYSFIPFGFGSSLLQIFLDQCYIAVFGSALCVLIVLLAIQKPEEEIDPQIGVYNSKTFNQIFDITTYDKEPATLYLIFIEDMALMNQAIGVTKVDGYLSEIGKFLRKISADSAFYLGGSIFGVLLNMDDEALQREFVRTVEQRFEKGWVYDNDNIYMACRMLQLMVPEDVQSLEAVQSYKDYLKEANRKQWFLRAEDTTISQTKRRMEVDKAIRRGIDDDHFQVYYQPIYSTEKD